MNQRAREAIEDAGRNASLRQIMEESRDSFGMQTFDQSLFDLVNNGHIEYAEALRMSTNPDDFQLRFSGVQAGSDQWRRSEGGDRSSGGDSPFELELDGISSNGRNYGAQDDDD